MAPPAPPPEAPKNGGRYTFINATSLILVIYLVKTEVLPSIAKCIVCRMCPEIIPPR